ncbi:type II secretion system F family protein [Neomegalonema sp.]|uniref:type II secretion system F family protein n=1 Tax=Neomegalonema sp. TaxID=2039713 RepID=UPI002610258F|nr:type II secretion system F family protein [Neomegalonema sp.]MDD2868837.1 type II secretion system F family protein [Neomegalonema sp.]
MNSDLILMITPFVAPLLAGFAVGGILYALIGMRSSEASSLTERLESVRRRRENLRGLHRMESGGRGNQGPAADKKIRAMRNTVEKFRLQEMINDTSLRQKLARAGFRSRNAAIVYVFFCAMLPIVAGSMALVYMWMFRAGDFDLFRTSVAILVAAAAGYYAPTVFLSNLTQKRQKEMLRAYPDALDLMVICVESGMSIEKAFHKVMHEITPQSKALSEEIGLLTAELSFLGDRGLAYENFANRTGLQPVKALMGALVQAEKYGTPVGQALRVLSEESRNERMSLAERKAAALPAKLTVPMIIFFLPVLFIVIIGPAVIQVRELM